MRLMVNVTIAQGALEDILYFQPLTHQMRRSSTA